ncbi:Uncharacterised protein g8627 [Pycnogonum litorale]
MSSKVVHLIVFSVLTVAMVTSRTVMQLPSGAEEYLGTVETSFVCDGKPYGYYADVEFDCRIYHVCYQIEDFADQRFANVIEPTGRQFLWSFFCPPSTHFDQRTLTCTSVDIDVRCQDARRIAVEANSGFGKIRESPIDIQQ